MQSTLSSPEVARRPTALRTGRRRDHASTLVVAGMTAFFGTVLVEAVAVIEGVVSATGASAASVKIGIGLSVVAAVFVLVAIYVGCVVTTNAFGTVIAGRRRSIALLRLVGAEGRVLRRAVAIEGLWAGASGAAIGAATGIASAVIVVAAGISGHWLPSTAYALLSPYLVVPGCVVVLTTWWAAWVGCRAVTTVSPLEATAVAATQDARGGRSSVRFTACIVLIASGAVLMALGVMVGLILPVGLLPAFFGGVLSFTGIVLGAGRIMPPLLGLTGQAWSRGAVGRIAVGGVSRYPERSARTGIALVIGVTLVTTFAVALTGFHDAAAAKLAASPGERAILNQSVTTALWALTAIIGFSALIAGVGLVNTMLMGVLQRTRELGLLRALGLSRSQLRSMIAVESAHVTVTALVFGFILGCIYGWVAAQALMGSAVHRLMPPDVPWDIVVIVAAAAVVLSTVAAATAARRAVHISPVAAMAVE
ncbi:ABC transporter permease [Humibacter ginsengisoli]